MSLPPTVRRIAARAGTFAALAALQPSVAAGAIRTLASDAEHVVVEIRPEPAEITTIQAGGHDYVQLSIPQMGLTDRPGEPELPVSSVRIAVPPNTVPRLTVRAVEWSARRSGAVRPCPERIGVRDPFGPSQVTEREPVEDARYRSATVHPREPFSLSEVKGLRDLRVVELQYHGAEAETFARGYRLLQRAVLEVRFERVEARGRRRVEHPVEPEELWRRTYRSGVLNRPEASLWARGGPGDGTSVGDRPWGGGDQWKVEVNVTGIREIPYSALATAGFPSGVPVAQVSVYQRLFDLDRVDDSAVPADSLFRVLPVPTVMLDRNGNGIFDDQDGVAFWGRSVRDQWMTSGWEHEDLFDRRNFVFVRVDPSGGARMAKRAGTVPSAAADSLECTPSVIFREEDRRYSQYPADFGPGRDGFETEFYYWNDHTTATGGQMGWSFSDGFTPVDLVADSTATLTARVCPTGRPLFHIRTNIVDFSVGDSTWTRQFYNYNFYTPQVVVHPDSVMNVITLPAGLLTSDVTNTFGFRGRSYLGAGTATVEFVARFLFDWYQIEYPRHLIARGDALRLNTSRGSATEQRIRVRGFSTAGDLLLVDVTDPGDPVLVSPFAAGQLVPGAGGTTDLRFNHDNAAGAGEYVAIRSSVIPKATAITPVAHPTLLAGGAGTKYVAVAHDLFAQGVRDLAAYRSTRYPGAVGTILSEVYDVFGGGRIHPDAIKAYAAYAYHRWTEPIVFLCLIGDASEDHQRVGGSTAGPDLLPSHSLWSAYEGAPEETDQYFAEVTRASGGGFDDLSDIYVGRLAVNTPEELDWNIQRMRTYENEDLDELWRRRVLLLADDALSGDLGGGTGSGYGWRPNEEWFCRASADFATLLENHPVDPVLVDLFCWAEYSHPCPNELPYRCNEHSQFFSGDCENQYGWDCGIWYDCRELPYSQTGWTREYPCERAAVMAAVLPRLRQTLNDGVFLWNFQGHANKYFLAHEEVWRDDNTRGDVDDFTNERRPFIFLGFACHLAEFDRDDEGVQGDCLSEKMMNVHQAEVDEPAGCIASFASSGYEFLTPNLTLNEFVVQSFYFPEQIEADSSGLGLPDDGEPNAYVWTLGEATTRARLLFQEQIGGADFRAAARRFILLGDPALSPDFGTPAIEVTVNGEAVEDPTADFFAPPAEFAGVNQVVVTATEGRGVAEMRVVDSARGPVDPAGYQVTTVQQTVHGVPQIRRLEYDFQLRPGEIYSLTFEAIDGAGHAAKFVMRTDTRFEFVDGQAATYPNPFHDRTQLVFRLPSQARGGTLAVYTVSGKRLLEKSIGALDANEQIEVEWDGRDDNGLPVANGTYFLRLKLAGTIGGSIEETFPVVRMR